MRALTFQMGHYLSPRFGKHDWEVELKSSPRLVKAIRELQYPRNEEEKSHALAYLRDPDTVEEADFKMFSLRVLSFEADRLPVVSAFVVYVAVTVDME